jgi:hypothetical protein
MHRYIFIIAIAWQLAASGGGVAALASERSMEDPDYAVEVAGNALGNDWSQNWYDPETDNIRPLKLRVPKQPSQQAQQSSGSSQTRSAFWDWLDSWLQGLHPSLDAAALLEFLFWITAIVVAVYLGSFLVRKYLRDQRQRFAKLQMVDPRAHSVDRVEALPMVVDEAVHDLLAEAHRLQQSGDLSGAITYLFSHQLLELDKAHLVQLVKGKTNRQYLRELRRNARQPEPLAQIVRETVELFEATFFGGRTPSQASFASCWNQVQQFTQLVQQNTLAE